MRIAAPEFGPVALIEVRVLVASIFLLPIWMIREAKSTGQAVRRHWHHITIVGLLNSAIPFVLFAYATLYITGGFASILNATAPLWTALVAWLWLHKSPSREGAFGLLIGTVGVWILVSPSLSRSLDSASLGMMAAALAAVLYGISANYTAEKLGQVSPLAIATFSQVAATIVLLPFAIMAYPSTAISWQSWLSVMALGIVCTGLAYTLFFRLIANIGSTKAITVTFLIPMFGSFWGAVFIDELITSEMIIGTLVILSGTALVTGLVSFKQ